LTDIVWLLARQPFHVMVSQAVEVEVAEQRKGEGGVFGGGACGDRQQGAGRGE